LALLASSRRTAWALSAFDSGRAAIIFNALPKSASTSALLRLPCHSGAAL
jgi:hypothetical protein